MNAEQKRRAVALGQLHKRLIQTIQILTMDAKFADVQMQKDKLNEQFWRRTVIRCVCALVEGTLSVLKAVAPETAGFFNVSLTENDMEIVTEMRLDKTSGIRKPAFLTPRESMKESIKVFAKAHAIQATTKYDDPAFEDLCETFQLRNKLMHPRNSLELAVTDNALKNAVRGWNWFDSTLVNLLSQSAEQLQH